MTTSYTSLLGLALPVTGELSGTWGDTVNNYITSYLDAAVAGAQTISGTQTAVTLSTTNGTSLSQAGSGGTGSAQYTIINCTGSPASLLTITVPAASKVYLVLNATSTSQSVAVVGAGPTTGVTVVSGEKALIAWNGTDFVKVATASGAATFSSVTVTGLTASQAVFTDASKNLVSNAITGTGNVVMSASPTLTGTITASAITASGTLTGSAAVTFSGTTTNLSLGTSQTSGTWTAGGTSQTGAMTLGRSTGAQTINIATGATTSGTTKTVNLGTAGVSGSTTAINIGSAVSGATNTITISGNPTLSAGTANGVLYLDGSKVATSGSALTFDGTSILTMGTNTIVRNSSGYGIFRTDTDLYLDAKQGGVSGDIIFRQAGSEQMRLTSTGLGIGTSSPGQKLSVATASGNCYAEIARASKSTGQVALQLTGGTSGTNWIIYQPTNSDNLTFFGNSSDRMVLDSSGNLGIGTTSPSSYGKLAVFGARTTSSGEFLGGLNVSDTTTGGAAGVGGVVTFGGDTQGAGTKQFAAVLGGKENSTLTDYAGYLGFYTRPGGGSLTEVARITSAGNLGLGVTPSAWAGGQVAFQNKGGALSAGSTTELYLGQNVYFGSGADRYVNSAAASSFGQSNGAFTWRTAASGTAGNAISFTQAMTLDASGQLAIGRTSAGATLDIEASGGASTYWRRTSFANRGTINVDGTNATVGSEGALIFGAGSGFTERARITSGGDLLVGTTSGGFTGRLLVKQDTAASEGISVWNSGTSGTRYLIGFYSSAGATGVGAITTDGTNTTYATSSDYRLKDNQQPLTGSGTFIDALKPKTWTWKADGSAGVGFIAHEVQEISPSSVVGEKDGEQMQAMEYGSAEFIANIIAELQSLRKRVAQLEGN